MRAAGITFISLALTSAVIGNAYYQKKQFYPSVVYITKSNPSMAVIYVQALILVVLMGKLMRKIFFGQLRAAEFEHLMERSWYAVTETCLAFTVFRDDFSPKFVALFTVLLFIKSFHWLAEERVDFMERSPVISWLFHLRVLSLLSVLGALDLQFVGLAYLSTITKGASVQLVFGFEYAILLTIIINIFIKYILHTLDLNSENPWDNKAVFLLYTELVMGFFKVILYIAFVAIMVRIYTLPLFAFRPMYYTMRAFKKAFNDVILSRRAIRNMNTLYPDATREELAAADNVCIICREEMVTASKKLPCNHIFHTSCLRSWFQRQQTCPTCRLNILRTSPPPPAPAPAAPRHQAPAPAQQPAQPQAQVGGNPFAPGFMPFWQPFQHLQQPGGELPANQPPLPGTSAQVQGTGQTVFRTELLSHPNQPPNMFPFFNPPVFPPLPFSMPPPPPPANLAELSPEELARMEGSARENVEARLQCLRNIQLLLDASVVLMHQYSTAAAASSRPPPPPAPTPAPTPTPTPAPRDMPDGGASTSSSSEAAAPITPVEQVGPSSEPSADPVLTKEQDEIRRRRLEKFASQTVVPEQENV